MPDLPISQLPQLTGPVATDDALPLVDASASETKKVTAKDLVQKGIQLIDAGSIPSDKFNVNVPDGSITGNQLADGSVTAAKLADQSCVLYKDPSEINTATGDFVGQLFIENSTEIASVWTGSDWEALAGVLVASGSAIDPLQLDATITGHQLSVTGFHKPTNAPNQFLAGPTDAAGAVNYRAIVSTDLPIASDVDLGGVKPGTGLTVDGNGILSVDNTVAPSTANHIVTYDANGLVTGGRAITGPDLPASTDSAPGVVRPGTGLAMGSNAELNHSNAVSAGNATKISFDAQGHVTAALPLGAADIPDLSFDQITSGQLDGASIADRSVTEIKLSDYSTCYVQEGQPSGDPKLGQFWFTPSTSQLRVYGRGSGGDLWLSVGFGALQAQNLRWGGTINADTSQIIVVTDIGQAEGLKAGDPIPAPTDELSGMYFVTQEGGSNISLDYVQSETFTEGDWLLCINQAQGYTHLDVAAGGGGGGGGGASYLDDLLDVTIGTIALADGQSLVYNGGTGQWNNKALTAADVGALAAGDDISELNNDAGYLTSADVGDGTITIKTDGGGTVGTFTVNQSGDTEISLPPAAAVGDGKITIKAADGTEVGDFTVNQAGDTEITLPAQADPTNVVKLDDGGTEQLITGGGGLTLDTTEKLKASNIAVNYDGACGREGIKVNGDISLNGANYGLRLYGSDNLNGADGFVTLSKSVSGDFSIIEAGGWGKRYYFGATQDFINISNDNNSGDPTPISGATAVVHVYNGLNTQFGTSGAPLGNVMPKDDWSSIPALP